MSSSGSKSYPSEQYWIWGNRKIVRIQVRSTQAEPTEQHETSLLMRSYGLAQLPSDGSTDLAKGTDFH